MSNMQTSLPLLIVRPSILNPVKHFSTQPSTGEMKCPRLYLCLAHFHFISIHQLHPPSVDATNAPTPSWMIWSNPYHHMTFLVHRSWSCPLFTVASVHRRQVLPKLHRLAVHRFKALTCPIPLQPVQRNRSSWVLSVDGNYFPFWPSTSRE